MQITTTRFGALELRADETIEFPAGLPGFNACKRWALLADHLGASHGWLQSLDQGEVALPVVAPRRYVPDYQLLVPRNELVALQLASAEEAQVLVVVGRNERGMTLNLKAPIVINVARRLGRQVVSNADLPMQYPLWSEVSSLRKSA